MHRYRLDISGHPQPAEATAIAAAIAQLLNAGEGDDSGNVSAPAIAQDADELHQDRSIAEVAR